MDISKSMFFLPYFYTILFLPVFRNSTACVPLHLCPLYFKTLEAVKETWDPLNESVQSL